VHTDPQVGRMYVRVSKFEKLAPNQNNRPHLAGEMVQNSQKMGVYAVLGHLGTPNLTQKGTQRPVS
jgi:hypothetical protein